MNYERGVQRVVCREQSGEGVKREENHVCIESICWQCVAPSNGSYKLLYALLQMLSLLLLLFSLLTTYKGSYVCVCVCVIEIVLAIISQELQRDKHNENKRNNNSNRCMQVFTCLYP